MGNGISNDPEGQQVLYSYEGWHCHHPPHPVLLSTPVRVLVEERQAAIDVGWEKKNAHTRREKKKKNWQKSRICISMCVLKIFNVG